MFFPLKDENPTRIVPGVIYFLVATNILVYIYQKIGYMGDPFGLTVFFYQMGVVPDQLFSLHQLRIPVAQGYFGLRVALVGSWFPQPLSLLTSQFVHGSVWHLVGNLWFLWIFGDNVEERLGHLRFLGFYVVSGFCAAAAQVLQSLILGPGHASPMIGASGAIAGVLGAYLYFFPTANVICFFIIILIRVPAIILLALWFLLQVTNSLQGGGGVAWYAHVGGFLFGLLVAHRFASRRPTHRGPRLYGGSVGS